MTDERMNLRTLREKSSDADLPRDMVRFAVQRVMELEVENLTSVAPGRARGFAFRSGAELDFGRARWLVLVHRKKSWNTAGLRGDQAR